MVLHTLEHGMRYGISSHNYVKFARSKEMLCKDLKIHLFNKPVIIIIIHRTNYWCLF